MPAVSTLKMAACLRSREEPDAVCWAEVAWAAEAGTRAVQWVGYVQGNACAGITWDEGRGFMVYINQVYMGHAATAQEAAEEAAALLGETPYAIIDLVTALMARISRKDPAFFMEPARVRTPTQLRAAFGVK